jgi:hypothetical protein
VLLRKRWRVVSRIEFANVFSATLHRYLDSRGEDAKAYQNLMLDSNKMQRELGVLGLVSYRPAAENIVYSRFPVISNLLPQFHREIHDRFLSTTTSPAHTAQMLSDTMLRYQGSLQEADEFSLARLKNPIAWLAEGGRAILTAPISLLRAFGVLSQPAYSRIEGARITRVIGGIVALLAFVSSVVTIVVGWDAFVQILVRIFS